MLKRKISLLWKRNTDLFLTIQNLWLLWIYDRVTSISRFDFFRTFNFSYSMHWFNMIAQQRTFPITFFVTMIQTIWRFYTTHFQRIYFRRIFFIQIPVVILTIASEINQSHFWWKTFAFFLSILLANRTQNVVQLLKSMQISISFISFNWMKSNKYTSLHLHFTFYWFYRHFNWLHFN